MAQPTTPLNLRWTALTGIVAGMVNAWMLLIFDKTRVIEHLGFNEFVEVLLGAMLLGIAFLVAVLPFLYYRVRKANESATFGRAWGFLILSGVVHSFFVWLFASVIYGSFPDLLGTIIVWAVFSAGAFFISIPAAFFFQNAAPKKKRLGRDVLDDQLFGE